MSDARAISDPAVPGRGAGEAAGIGSTFFRSRWVDAPEGVEEVDPAELAPGFRVGAVACGLKGGGRTVVAVTVPP